MYAMSSTKSVAGLLTGMLIEDGRIKGMSEPVCTFIETWCTGLRARVTVRHLLTMTSGLPIMQDSSVGFIKEKNAYVMRLTPTAEPGARWAYSNEGAQLLSPILDRAAGEPIQDYARRRLFEPLGMTGTHLHVYPAHAWTYADMETSARDFARLGVLMLNRGVWNGRQIVSGDWVVASTRPSQSLNARYGLLWWIDPEINGYAAHGHLDTDLHVIPDLDLVIVRMQSKPVSGVEEGQYEREGLSLFRKLITKRN
jgi:CubicO group peptidase (beta-lactamase class C family)